MQCDRICIPELPKYMHCQLNYDVLQSNPTRMVPDGAFQTPGKSGSTSGFDTFELIKVQPVMYVLGGAQRCEFKSITWAQCIFKYIIPVISLCFAVLCYIGIC